MKLPTGGLCWVALGALLLVGCGNDHAHPPFVSGTCAVPPCSTPTSRGVGIVDAGQPADAAVDAKPD